MTTFTFDQRRLSRYGLTRRSLLAAGGSALAASALPFRPAQAQDKGKVTIRTWETYHDDPWLAEFTANTGIEVQVVRAGSVDEMYATTRSGAVNPDLVFADTSSTPRYLAADLLAPIEPDRVPNAANIDPSLDWKTFNLHGGGIYGVPYAWGSLPLMYNAASVSPAPTSWKALWDPAHAGKVSTFDDAFLNIPMVAMSVGAADPINTTPEEDALIVEALRQLRPQMRTIARGFDDMATLFQSGEAVIAFCQNIAIPMGLQGNGMDVPYVYPDEGTLAWVDNALLTKSGAGRPEVYAFIDACLAPTWQARFTQTSGNNCVIPPALALANGLSQEVVDKGEMKSMTDPAFWGKMRILQEQRALDQRLQVWNDFKAGVL
jgi:spermidine/putrescine transport system substrate-binding protein